MQPIGKKEALFIAKKLHADFVYNMARYENNPFTYPEVKTVLEGITVGGHKLSDQDQILNISRGWQEIIHQVVSGNFQLTKENFIHINEIVAKDEALSVGDFRHGSVSISGTDYMPPDAKNLDIAFNQMIENHKNESDTCKKAFGIFLDAARTQFFFDGNKRTAQLMMNGYLIQAGYPPISLRPDVAQKYNEKMVNFYKTGDKHEMFDFLNEQQLRLAAEFSGISVRREAFYLSEEAKKRIDAIPFINGGENSACVFRDLSKDIMKQYSDLSLINWHGIEWQTAVKAIGELGYPPSDVIRAISEHSPTCLTQDEKSKFSESVRKAAPKLQDQYKKSQMFIDKSEEKNR